MRLNFVRSALAASVFLVAANAAHAEKNRGGRDPGSPCRDPGSGEAAAGQGRRGTRHQGVQRLRAAQPATGRQAARRQLLPAQALPGFLQQGPQGHAGAGGPGARRALRRLFQEDQEPVRTQGRRNRRDPERSLQRRPRAGAAAEAGRDQAEGSVQHSGDGRGRGREPQEAEVPRTGSRHAAALAG